MTSVPMTISGRKIYVPVSINDTKGLFLVDTGSDETLLDESFAERAGAGLDRHAGQRIFTGAGNRGTLPVNMGHVRQTKIGEIAFPDWEYAMLDLSRLLPQDVGATGILGRDFLHFFDMEADFTANTLSFFRMTDCTDMQPPGWTGDYDAIPLKHGPRGERQMPIFIDDAYLNVTFDTGAAGLLLTRDAAEKAGATPAALESDAGGGASGLGGSFATVRHRFKLLLIGSGVYPNALLPVEDTATERDESDGLIGLLAFHAKKIWISFTTGTLFVQGAPKAK